MIEVRRAQPHQLSDMVAFGRKVHEAGNYGPHGYNSVMARRTIKACMTEQDHRAWVALKDGEVVGLLLAAIEPAGWFSTLQATDIAFAADQGGDLLLDAFVAWCKLRKVGRIDMGISAGQGRDAAMDRLFRSRGFAISGSMYHMNILPEAAP